MFWRRRRRWKDFSQEIQTHIALETDRLIGEGMSRKEAHATAIRRFGNITAAEERFYESRRMLWLDHLRQDVRYAARSLGNNAGIAAIAAMTLALGIGASTAVFSVVKAVLIESLPYRQPDRLVHIVEHLPASQTIDAKPRSILAMDVNELSELRSRTQTLSRVAAYDSSRELTLTGLQEPIRVVGTPISTSLFPTLGAQPLVGRNFEALVEDSGQSQTLILSYSMWQNYFGSDPNILSRSVTLNGRQYSIVGVMPRDFEFPDRLTQFWLPLDLTPTRADIIRSVIPIARIRDGITTPTAVSETTAIIRNLRQTYPPNRVVAPGEFEFLTIKDQLVRPVQPALLVLTASVGLVLLIACSNVANLLLARGSARGGEFAIRSALGAGRGRLIRQTLTESCLLALIGGAAGCLFAFAGVRLLRSFGPDSIPRLESIAIDTSVLVFTLALSVVTGLIFGAIPALHLSGAHQMDVIKVSGRMKSSEGRRARNVIVVAEIGMAVMLLIGGGLLMRSFLKLSNVDPGFDPSRVLMFQVALPEPASLNTLTETVTQEFLDRLKSLPGVEAAGFANAVPLVPRNGFSQPRIAGTPLPIQGIPEFREVSRDYFAVMRVRLVAGRSFNDRDERGQPRGAIINRTMARYFGGDDPIGKTITLARDTAEIVGIIDDIHEQALNIEPRPQVYIDSRQGPGLLALPNVNAFDWAYFVVRVDRDPISLVPDVRSILGQMVPNATLKLNVASMEQVISRSVARPRFNAVLLGIFGGIAVLLATIGVYGITTYSVAQRTREIGIRLALGAQAREVVTLAFRESILLAVMGLGLGIAGALMFTRYLNNLLFDLTPIDPATFIFVSAGFALTVALASYVPARHAVRIDPVVALRHE